MQRFSSIFSQILQMFSRNEFASAVKQHKAEKASKGFSSWGQFIAMLFCQLGSVHKACERYTMVWPVAPVAIENQD